MELKDIGTKELKELNLYPLNHFKDIKQCFEQGYYIIPSCTNRGGLTDILWASTHKKEGEIVELKSFEEMTKEDFEKMFLSGKTLFKLLWMQKYFNGDVSAPYDVYQDETYQSFQELAELNNKDKIIQRLRTQLDDERNKNKELKLKIIEMENEVKKANKLKSRLVKFIADNRKLLEEYSSELN